MSLPTTELLIFPTSDAYKQNPAIAKAAIDIVFNYPGARDGYYGLQKESSDVGYIIINWDTLKHHQNVMASPNYPKVIAALTPSLGGEDTKMYHIAFSGPLPVKDAASVTVITYTLKSPAKREEVVKLVKKGAEASEGKIVWGQTVEDENTYFLICGWPTAHDHSQILSEEDTKSGREILASAGVISIKHANLTTYI